MARADFKLEPPVRVASTPPAMPLGAMPELFFCEPYKTRLRKPACASRWLKVNTGAQLRVKKTPQSKAHEPSGVAVQFRGCIGCPVGAGHVKESPPGPSAKERQREIRMADVVVRRAAIAASIAATATKSSAPTEARREELMAEKKACALCGKTFEPVRADARFCSDHTKAEKLRWYAAERERTASARRGGPSAGADKPGAAPEPATKTRQRAAAATSPRSPVADVRAAAREAASHVGAAGVLRALGFEVTELAVPAGVALLVHEAGA